MARGSRSRNDDPDTGRRKVREYDQDFEVRLDAEGRAGEALAACDLYREYESIELEKKTANTAWTKRMKEIRAALSKHTTHALNGKREDKVKVEEFFNVASGKVELVKVGETVPFKERRPTKVETDEWLSFGDETQEGH